MWWRQGYSSKTLEAVRETESELAQLGCGIKTMTRRERERMKKQPEGINNHQPGQWDG